MLGMIKSVLFWQPADFGASGWLFFFSHWFSWLVILGLSGWWFWKKKYKNFASFWALSVLSGVLETLIKYFSPWSRPFFSSGAVPPEWMGSYSQGSFPSGHAIRSVIILYYAWKIDRRLFWVLLPGMVLVNLGRIFSALHYPVDIFGGVILGLMLVWGLEKISKSFRS